MPRLDDAAVEEGPAARARLGAAAATRSSRSSFRRTSPKAAEAAGHHPDIDIRWNVALSSAPFPYSTQR